jgi:hypothetical protein
MQIWQRMSIEVPYRLLTSTSLAVIYEGRTVVKGRRGLKESEGRPGATPLR